MFACKNFKKSLKIKHNSGVKTPETLRANGYYERGS